VFSGVHVTRSLVLCVCVVDRCLSFCTFSFGYGVVCSFRLLEHLSSHTVVRGVRVTRSFVFCVMFCRPLFVLLVIVLSVLLQITASDYPFGIFKLFLGTFPNIIGSRVDQSWNSNICSLVYLESPLMQLNISLNKFYCTKLKIVSNFSNCIE